MLTRWGDPPSFFSSYPGWADIGGGRWADLLDSDDEDDEECPVLVTFWLPWLQRAMMWFNGSSHG